VPLSTRDSVLALFVLRDDAQRALTTDELDLLRAVGRQVGVAVENATLYATAEEAAVTAERSRLARELHDSVTQTLFSANLIAGVLPLIWERDPQAGRERLAELHQLTTGALAEMRALLLELRPTALAEADLGTLLTQLADGVGARARIPVSVSVAGEASIPAVVKVGLYRIAQEALNNAAKPSGASQVVIELRAVRRPPGGGKHPTRSF